MNPSDDRLNPVVLITGAACVLGAACARELAHKASGGLILVDRDERRLSAAADAIGHAPERVSTLAFDIADSARWDQAQDFIADQYGRLDWALMNTGGGGEANFAATRLALRAAMALMRANTHGGAIVLTGEAARGAARAGLSRLTRLAAKEGAPDRIRVNAIGLAETGTPHDAPIAQDLARLIVTLLAATATITGVTLVADGADTL